MFTKSFEKKFTEKREESQAKRKDIEALIHRKQRYAEIERKRK